MRETQINEWIMNIVTGTGYFSSAQRKKVRDMVELEFHSSGHQLIKEGVISNKAYIIVKGEVELSSSTNLYTLSM